MGAVPRRKPAALFVYGIEQVFDYAAGYTHAIAILNLNRGYIAQRFRYTVVFWAPDFAMVEFSRQAADRWSATSGSFHFSGGSAETAETLQRLDEADFWSSDARDKVERKLLLERVCRELESEPQPDSQALADARMRLGGVLYFEGQHDEAERLYEDALPLYRQIGARLGEANVLKARGDVAGRQARYQDAERLYEEALPLYRQIGFRLGEAHVLKARGVVAARQAHYQDARAAVRGSSAAVPSNRRPAGRRQLPLRHGPARPRQATQRRRGALAVH
jgi:tetratricopeptide (TPR) repeat protein